MMGRIWLLSHQNVLSRQSSSKSVDFSLYLFEFSFLYNSFGIQQEAQKPTLAAGQSLAHRSVSLSSNFLCIHILSLIWPFIFLLQMRILFCSGVGHFFECKSQLGRMV